MEMPSMKLTDVRVRSAKPGQSLYKLSDGGGLHILVLPSGSKLWRLAYRFAGKQKTLALGSYPTVSLAVAREQRERAKGLLRSGIDPSAERKAAKAARKTGVDNSFGAIAEECIAKWTREGRAEATLEKKRYLLRDLARSLADRPIRDITALELLSALRSVEVRGKFETARRLRNTCGMVFRYAIATARADRDPSADLRGALTVHRPVSRPAIIAPDRIAELLRAIDGCTGLPATVAALRLLPLVFLRPGELRQAKWNDIDLTAAEWTVPAVVMKMRRPHRVPLSRQALVVLQEQVQIAGDSIWVFPGIGHRGKPLSENTLNHALWRLGFKGDMSPHGFRTMASTRLNEMRRWSVDAIEMQLAHKDRDTIRGIYNQAAYWNERVEMIQAWADYLDHLRGGGQVVPLRSHG
jgi:integrase